MNVLLVAIGTRGDMEPVITLGQLLQDRGHQVSVLLPEQFCALAQQARLNPISLGPRWYEFMMSILNSFTDASMSWWKRCTSLLSAIKESKPIHDEIAKHIHNTVITTNPDRIVFSAKALFAAIYNIDQPGRAIFHCPLPYLHKTRYHTHVGFKGRKAGAWLNKLSYRLVDHKVTKLLVDSAKQLNIAHVDKQSVKNVLETQTAIYTLSPALFERPKDWRDNIKVLGFHERDKTDQWSPDNALLSFLDRHEKILFVTFGSMTNSKPEQNTKLLLSIFKQHGIPAIINTYAGGLLLLDDWQDDNIHFIQSVPYDWIFPKVYAVLHHGGAGTTHMAVKYGCPSMIIPHAVDQFVWNNIIFEKGLGPKGLPMGKLKRDVLENAILDLMNNDSYLMKAKRLSEKMARDADLIPELIRTIEKGK